MDFPRSIDGGVGVTVGAGADVEGARAGPAGTARACTDAEFRFVEKTWISPEVAPSWAASVFVGLAAFASVAANINEARVVKGRDRHYV